MPNMINHKSLAEHIFEDLEAKIISGALKPGQRIIEEELCNSYGVSRSPLREALRMLESSGFIERKPRKGVSVTKITAKEAEDIYTIRARLDSLAIYLAINKKKPNVLERLKKLHQKMIETAGRNNVAEYYKLNRLFHDTISRACDNQRLIQLLDSFDKQTMRYRRMVLREPGWMNESIKNHAAIIQWFETGDGENAERFRQSAILRHVKERFSMAEQGENNED